MGSNPGYLLKYFLIHDPICLNKFTFLDLNTLEKFKIKQIIQTVIGRDNYGNRIFFSLTCVFVWNGKNNFPNGKNNFPNRTGILLPFVLTYCNNNFFKQLKVRTIFGNRMLI